MHARSSTTAAVPGRALLLGRLVAGLPVIGVAALAGWGLSLLTTRVENWFVMTDELYYQRLAISVAQTGSLLPRLQGEVVSNLNQLYPVLLSTVYGHGDVPASFDSAHRLNAYVMASAAIPVYLLARKLGVGRVLGLAAAALSVVVPWMVLASFLLTEVVAYPAFCWAVLALVHATARKTALADLLAVGALVLAVTARAQFFVLALVLALAVATEALLEQRERGLSGRPLLRAAASSLARRRLLIGAFLAGVVALVVAAISGEAGDLLGSYAVTAEGIHVDGETLRLVLEQWGVLVLATGLVPLIVGSAWIVDRLRPAADSVQRGFGVVAAWAVVAVLLQVASFNQRFGAGLV
ncbi:MAG: hypothetical protein FJW96_01875 [Actinobacteria bacterium]|nr:hypothetical protein [Actinomycetota bacterium]